MMADQMQVFLQNETNGFIESLFKVLDSKDYLNGPVSKSSKAEDVNNDASEGLDEGGEKGVRFLNYNFANGIHFKNSIEIIHIFSPLIVRLRFTIAPRIAEMTDVHAITGKFDLDDLLCLLQDGLDVSALDLVVMGRRDVRVVDLDLLTGGQVGEDPGLRVIGDDPDHILQVIKDEIRVRVMKMTLISQLNEPGVGIMTRRAFA